MNLEKVFKEFVGQYIIVLSKYRRILFERGYEKVYEKIDRDILLDIFYLYYRYYVREEKIKRSDIADAFQTVLGCSLKEKMHSVQLISSLTWMYGREKNEKNNFFILLLLCMHLLRIYEEALEEKYYTYLVKIPFETLGGVRVNSLDVSGKFQIKEAMEIIESFFDKYTFVLVNVELEEYHIDFVKVKLYYEHIFFRFKYGIEQWKCNEI